MVSYWFTGDYHLGHKNIIKYCNRPFKSLYHMDSTIIKNHNNRVKPDDTVFYLGDFCFRNTKNGKDGEGEVHKAEHYLKQLNGNFVFIRGNHDSNNSLKTIIECAVIHFGGLDILLVHNPADCEPNIKYCFHAHVHTRWKFKKDKKHDVNLINVGVDQWKFAPVSFAEIMNGRREWLKRKEDK